MLPELRRLAVRAYLARLTLDEKPILIGPWRSEVGFEALYWLPFLRWCAKQVPSFRSRAYVVTRGGAQALYEDVAPRGVDLYSLRSVTEVRRENLYDWTKTKLQKQTRVTDWDRKVLDEAMLHIAGQSAAECSGFGRGYHILHPSWMYWALAPFWEEQRGLQYLFSLADYTPLPKPEIPSPEDILRWVPSGSTPAAHVEAAAFQLPPRYVAMKFYGRATFPVPHPDTARFVSEIAGIVSAQVPVVLLNSGHPGDDHTDIPISGPNIHHLPQVPPEQNLALQAAVLGKAVAFVGTYGGVSQLALRMGVPSASFWTEFGGTAHAHLSLSSYLSQRTGVPFLTGSLADTGLWRQLLAMPLKEAA